MFTGIIQTTGTIKASEPRGGDQRLTVAFDGSPGVINPGDSIAVNGCCLTAIEPSDKQFTADVSRETLNTTTLGNFTVDTPVNLETAATPTTLLGGHMVSGHVDAVARIVGRQADARSQRLDVKIPAELARFIAAKGSVSIDGVSLTVNAIKDDTFSVNIVPHTQQATIIKNYQVGTAVNLEVDIIARYLARLAETQTSGLNTVLIDNGFIKN